ncbi:MAG TPA: recombination mediator RecR [Candidatus Polarisedimenticolaceae bacterium]
MSTFAAPLERVIVELAKLPGIGRKTAQRLAFHLLDAPASDARALAEAIAELRERIRFCARCFNVGDAELCPVCADPRRDGTSLCVVEHATDVAVFERAAGFRGRYHVLGGALSPLRDVGPDDLHVRELLDRVGSEGVREVILATSPSVEGEATAVYLARLLKPLGVGVSRLAQGLPAGASLEFTDDLTLRRALEGRREY